MEQVMLRIIGWNGVRCAVHCYFVVFWSDDATPCDRRYRRQAIHWKRAEVQNMQQKLCIRLVDGIRSWLSKSCYRIRSNLSINQSRHRISHRSNLSQTASTVNHPASSSLRPSSIPVHFSFVILHITATMLARLVLRNSRLASNARGAIRRTTAVRSSLDATAPTTIANILSL